ncbi:MAG: hypothetical protein FJZ57_07655 [Chlamydiae bacterium]|nr:hypothetical protein [Chlamydiota bacterium]
MCISQISSTYFNGFSELYNFRQNNDLTNLVATLKVLSYFTIVIPLFCASLCLAESLCGRVSVITDPDFDQNIRNVAQNNGISSQSPRSSQPSFEQVMDCYHNYFKPQLNMANLRAYALSPDCSRHKETAKIYFNAEQMVSSDALRVAFQREPTNIAMGYNQYDKDQLQRLLGYQVGVYNDSSARKEDGSLFSRLPNTVSIYSETYLWPNPGQAGKKEVAILSLPAPALDTSEQPHYTYYIDNTQSRLNREKYKKEMDFLFKTIEQVLRDCRDSAFEGRGVQRLVLTKFGQNNFVAALGPQDREIAHECFKQAKNHFCQRIADLNIEVVLSVYGGNEPVQGWHDQIITGDILKSSRVGDLIINAWDPHSAPGNGNDSDHSFDGAIGKGTGVLLTQTSWLNNRLKQYESLVEV